MNGRWVKSNKIVNFPMSHFDPSEFVAKRSTSGEYDASEDASCVRTVNVRTIDEDGEDQECCPEKLTKTTSDKVRLQ